MKITDINRNDLSKAMQQYYDFKTQHLDKVVFFQLGDFFEMFFEDAIEVSNLLELTLTGKAAGLDEKIPMAGVPLSTLEDYLSKLTLLNKSVVIVEQDIENTTTKIIERKITRIVTPGTFYTQTELDNKFSGVLFQKEYYYLSYGDLNTGELYYSVFQTKELLLNEILNLGIREIIDINKVLKKDKLENINLVNYDPHIDLLNDPQEIVKMALVDYFTNLTQNHVEHLRDFKEINKNNFLNFSVQTQNQLELITTLKEQKYVGSLFWYLNKTSTAMGRRKLKEMIIHPLTDINSITKRLDIIDILLENSDDTSQLTDYLKQIYDFERLISKISNSTISPKELIQLKKSLHNLPQIKEITEELGLSIFTDTVSVNDLYNLLDSAIKDEPSNSLKDGGFIKLNYNEEVDYLYDLKDNSTTWLANYENEQRERTGIKTLKVKYNKVFGYFIEVTNSFLNNIPDDYIRKQTMTSCERFITQELKEKENDILNASEKLTKLEIELFSTIRVELKYYIKTLIVWANKLAQLDVAISFTNLALTNKLIRPTFNNERILEIKDGFHPIVKSLTNNYINNDIYLDNEQDILLITGPNMAGKSTYMRQILVTVIMSQMGCFVPAKYANMTIFDKIFTRIGASDDLASGKSTFMVEMSETAFALNNATKDSLLVFDELGRGTSTYDGIALAKSIIEYIHNKIHAKTLFSTHYHELTTLEEDLIRLQNYHVYAQKENESLVFFHKLIPGAVEKSYGIDVAKIADLPLSVIIRANEVIGELENSHVNVKNIDQKITSKEDERIKIISELNINEMTPIDALNKLQEIITLCKGG